MISLNSPSNRISTSKERMSHIDVTPYKNKSVPLNLSINQSKTPKDSIYNKKQLNTGLMKSDDRLNLSVDITNKSNGMNNKNIDTNLRLSRITEEKLNISVDGVSSSRGNSVINQMNENQS